ncbi:MAG: hypothetical protein ACOCWA_06295 [Bacteroidota bacterium]
MNPGNSSFWYTIIDFNGRDVKEGPIVEKHQSINIEDLKAGLYLLKPCSKDALDVVKIIKL